MSDKHKLALSRRQLLGGLGAVGAASAGAGLGTTALFSDEESFESNSLAAGTLDLKVSWDEHYFNGITNLDDVSGNNVGFGSPGDGETGFPTSSESPYLVVADSAVDTFMDDTRTQRFPSGGIGQDEDPCEVLADVPGEDLPRPVIGLTDVKPGDFGEVTFDFSVCDNAGYLWMTGNLTDEDENPVVEPETETPTDTPAGTPTGTPTGTPPGTTPTPTPTPPPDDGEMFTISQFCADDAVDENEDENEDEDEGGGGGDYTYTYVYDYEYEKGNFRYDYHYEYEWSEDAEQDPNPTAPPVDDSLACSDDGAGISPDPAPSPSPP